MSTVDFLFYFLFKLIIQSTHKTSNKYKFITLLRMLVNKVFTMMQAFQKKLSDFSESRLP